MERQNQGSKTLDRRRIGKAIVLPWSKAIEISFKGMQIRFWRSLITMSSIVLAIAFLMSIWTSSAIVHALRTEPAQQARAAEREAATAQQQLDARGELPAESLVAMVPAAIAYVRDEIGRLNKQIRELERVPEARRTDQQTRELQAYRSTLEQARGRLEVLDAANPSKSGTVSQAVLQTLLVRSARLRNRAENIRQILFREGIEEEEASEDQTEAAPQRSPLGFLGQMKPKDLWLVLLALLVCFVGIVNAMLMSVSERFREIGTMKCLGALDSFIVKLFLLESSFQGLAGTALGIVIGFVLSLLRASFRYGSYTYQYFPGTDILISIGLSIVAGVVLSVLAAVYPAHTAAKMEPVEAMRVEQ